MAIPEPIIKKSHCSYCGDAPLHHHFSYLHSLLFITFDNHIIKVANRAPNFLKVFVDSLLIFIFQIFRFFRIARFSSDIDKAKSFRSRVIWEEAKKRGIKMEQIIILSKPLDFYRATINGKKIYFESLPIPRKFLDTRKDWDDKFVLKEELEVSNIPIPAYFKLPLFGGEGRFQNIFEKLRKPIIVKPKVGSRGRHTITNINTLQQFKDAIKIVKQICPYIVVEEHISGYVCRATLVAGKLAGFYRGQAPHVVGDGKQTISELILEKDKNRHERVERVQVGEELRYYITRSGFLLESVLPYGEILFLSHRVGRLFGGATKEMLGELHSSFVPILEKTAKLLELAVVGFDCIIPDPEKSADSQKWGIIECNTLPFIDLHYYALEGKPQNIAGMIWDLWK